MKNTLVQFLTLVILALVVLLAKTLWWPSTSPAANNSITTASAAATAPGAATASNGAPLPAELASVATVGVAASADEHGHSPVKLDEATKEKIALSESTWVGTWGRQFPDPNSIDMDMSQLGKPGGKAVPIPYVAPAPLKPGMFITNGNGSLSTVYDDMIVLPDGSRAKIDNAKIVDKDGSLLGVRIGNEILWTDGSKSSY